ncbi:S-layer homology domain-containing protein [uncultured Flavonifractor sp.]|uniref:S-layer homology domain-containing protein n=1 Tax=uncultured Flavonifractor sp. TaxID=1193534 RepID=UPI00260A0A18|nr:S-layer homology domain-containing protein [uncultured Flavonifractor sp.]
MRLIKKWLSGALCLVLLLGLLPTAALAEDTPHWADSAVTVLNELYGSDIFSTSDEAMDTGAAQTVLNNMGRSDLTAPSPFNRAAACEVLADVFTLPVGEEAAITYLYEQNIVNGKSEDNLGAADPVSFAEFAVLTYRVLNFVGGGKGTGVAGLKPGTPGYMAWMYLAVRKCVPFVVGEDKTPIDINQTIGTATGIETYVSSALKPGYADIYDVSTAPKSGKEIWDAWEAALGDTNIGGIKDFSATGYDEDDTLVAAATKMVGQFMAQKGEEKDIIFHDVAPDNWFYDGIMYLANQNIVIGYGDGQFGPDDITPRFQFAVLLSVMDGTVSSTDTNPARISTAIDHVRKAGYLDIPESANDENPFTDFYWSQTTTREEAVVGILEMIRQTQNITTTSGNLAILDRFTDVGDIDDPDSKPYLAFAVSMGLLSGTSENTLSPNDPVSRAQTGVLLYRTLIGLDYTKMKDYRDSVDYAKTDSPVRTFALFAAPAPAANEAKTLTLREDWRLTGELDLAVPEGTTLTIDGQGKYHIYEMGGTLQNSGLGKVRFVNGATLYPAESGETCDPASSDALMEQRQPHKVTVAQPTNGSVTASSATAKEGETVTLTITADSGYEPADLNVTTADGTPITVTNNTFTMPAADVTVSATFRKVDSGSSGGSGPTNYSITPPSAVANGTVQVSPSRASKGSTVTITVTPDQGYELSSLTVEDRQGKALDLTDKGDGTYTFTMPASSVSIQAAFREIVDEVTPPFTDIREEDYYYDAVLWAVENGVTNGTGADTFSPDVTVSRAQMITFLWRAHGAPKATGSNPFTDVSADDYYYDAVLWAVENGVTTGTGEDTFAPHAPVSRAQAVTFQWRAAGSPAASGSGFDDVAGDAWYTDAVTWAVSEEITNGTGGNHFSPDAVVSRAQAVTFLYREQA